MQEERYYRFSRYLKERFGGRVHKVSIDAGFSCPNKDGRFSKEGCIYCDNKGFSYNTRSSPLPIEEQIEKGMNFGRRRFKAEKFILYFQAYTNTYAPMNVLKQKYNIVKKFKDIIGLSIGTRPDCVNEEILDLIKKYSSDYELWIEYGLQSIHNRSLEFINRNHSYQDFLRAVKLTKDRNIKICAHIIIGLPDESRKEVLETGKELGRLKLNGVKIHPLYIIKGTKLEEFLKQGRYKPLELDDYAEITAEFLEYLWPKTVIQRITADCPREFLAAPLWILDKNKMLKEIEDTLFKKGRFQGRLCS